MKKHFKPILVSLIALLIVGGAIYAQQRAERVNPGGEAVYQTDNGEVFLVEQQVNLGADPVLSSFPVDLIGTKTGTSTTGRLYDDTATSTDIIRIGTWADEAVITILAKNSSTTPDNFANFSILASSDTYCDTATTSTIFADVVTTDQINWFDAGNYIRNATAITSLGTGTTTIPWSELVAGTARQIILEELNAECLAFQSRAGNGVTLWAQIKTKHNPNN